MLSCHPSCVGKVSINQPDITHPKAFKPRYMCEMLDTRATLQFSDWNEQGAELSKSLPKFKRHVRIMGASVEALIIRIGFLGVPYYSF